MKTQITVSTIVTVIINLVVCYFFIINAESYDTKLLMFFMTLSFSGINYMYTQNQFAMIEMKIWIEQNTNSTQRLILKTQNKDMSYLDDSDLDCNEALEELAELQSYSKKLALIVSVIEILILYIVIN